MCGNSVMQVGEMWQACLGSVRPDVLVEKARRGRDRDRRGNPFFAVVDKKKEHQFCDSKDKCD